jgi:hypothetical protein
MPTIPEQITRSATRTGTNTGVSPIEARRFIEADTTSSTTGAIRRASAASDMLLGVSDAPAVAGILSAGLVPNALAERARCPYLVGPGAVVVPAGEALGVGVRVTSDADGLPIAASTGESVGGVTLSEAASPGDDILIELVGPGMVAP